MERPGISATPLATKNVAIKVGARALVSNMTVNFAAGEFVAVLGRNGCGKTLTLHTLAGLREPAVGTVLVDGIPFNQHNRRTVARRLGLLAQDLEDGFVTTSMETVLVGRHPHLAFWQWETAEDDRLPHEPLPHVGLGSFSTR